MDYDDGVLRDALHRLERRGYTRLASGAGSRAPKYRHLLDDALPMGAEERALLCVLILRGPQTPGELKQRAERLHPFATLDDVHRALARLIERELVRRLQRRPGQKEERYLQLLGEGAHGDGEDPKATAGVASPLGVAATLVPGGASSAEDRSATPPAAYGAPAAAPAARDGLEERVARLEREVADLRAKVVNA